MSTESESVKESKETPTNSENADVKPEPQNTEVAEGKEVEGKAHPPENNSEINDSVGVAKDEQGGEDGGKKGEAEGKFGGEEENCNADKNEHGKVTDVEKKEDADGGLRDDTKAYNSESKDENEDEESSKDNKSRDKTVGNGDIVETSKNENSSKEGEENDVKKPEELPEDDGTKAESTEAVNRDEVAEKPRYSEETKVDQVNEEETQRERSGESTTGPAEDAGPESKEEVPDGKEGVAGSCAETPGVDGVEENHQSKEGQDMGGDVKETNGDGEDGSGTMADKEGSEKGKDSGNTVEKSGGNESLENNRVKRMCFHAKIKECVSLPSEGIAKNKAEEDGGKANQGMKEEETAEKDDSAVEKTVETCTQDDESVEPISDIPEEGESKDEGLPEVNGDQEMTEDVSQEKSEGQTDDDVKVDQPDGRKVEGGNEDEVKGENKDEMNGENKDEVKEEKDEVKGENKDEVDAEGRKEDVMEVDGGKEDGVKMDGRKEDGVKVDGEKEHDKNMTQGDTDVKTQDGTRDHVDEPVTNHVASQDATGDVQRSSPTPSKDANSDVLGEMKRRAGSTVYRVQADYLTRQVIEKQEKEIYLEEKLSETNRDLEISERKVKDLQLRLKRFVKDDELKDNKMRQMERDYNDLTEQMQKIEESLDSNGKVNNNVGEVHNELVGNESERRKSNSKVCVIL